MPMLPETVTAFLACIKLGAIVVPIFSGYGAEALAARLVDCETKVLITVDGFLFMVPAKIGTQEGGKVVIFAALGLPASLGFAFGVIRHIRELSWAGLGLLLCYAAVGREGLDLRRAARSQPRAESPLR